MGQGRPAKIAATPDSFTGQFLTRYYASSNGKLAEVEAIDEQPQEEDPGSSSDGARTSVERAGDQKPVPKAKRVYRNTPAEDDLSATRAKAGSPAAEKVPAKPGPRAKKTGRV